MVNPNGAMGNEGRGQSWMIKYAPTIFVFKK